MYENEYEYECECEYECESQLIDLFHSVASNSFEAPHACCATWKCFALATQTSPIVQVQDQARQSTTVGNAPLTTHSGNSFERQQQQQQRRQKQVERQQRRQQCAACAAAFLVESASFIKFETPQRGAVVRSIMIYATLKSNWISDTNCCHNPRDMAQGC